MNNFEYFEVTAGAVCVDKKLMNKALLCEIYISKHAFVLFISNMICVRKNALLETKMQLCVYNLNGLR